MPCHSAFIPIVLTMFRPDLTQPWSAAHAFSYAQSKGLFFGASLEASAIGSRPDVNRGECAPIAWHGIAWCRVVPPHRSLVTAYSHFHFHPTLQLSTGRRCPCPRCSQESIRRREVRSRCTGPFNRSGRQPYQRQRGQPNLSLSGALSDCSRLFVLALAAALLQQERARSQRLRIWFATYLNSPCATLPYPHLLAAGSVQYSQAYLSGAGAGAGPGSPSPYSSFMGALSGPPPPPQGQGYPPADDYSISSKPPNQRI